MEMVPVSYDISCFCLTNNIFFIKNIAIFNFFMMFMCYRICSKCCSKCLLGIIFINKVVMIPVRNDHSTSCPLGDLSRIKHQAVCFNMALA